MNWRNPQPTLPFNVLPTPVSLNLEGQTNQPTTLFLPPQFFNPTCISPPAGPNPSRPFQVPSRVTSHHFNASTRLNWIFVVSITNSLPMKVIRTLFLHTYSPGWLFWDPAFTTSCRTYLLLLSRSLIHHSSILLLFPRHISFRRNNPLTQIISSLF